MKREGGCAAVLPFDLLPRRSSDGEGGLKVLSAVKDISLSNIIMKHN